MLKVRKEIGCPIKTSIEACVTYKQLDAIISRFNSNKALKYCDGTLKGTCIRNDLSPSLLTIERMGMLGCSCEYQPSTDKHL
jgi:hypothetical protein